MWVYSTSVNAKHGIRIFKYAPGRSGNNPKEFLKGFNGYLHTDGFSGYGKVKDIHIIIQYIFYCTLTIPQWD